MVQVNSVSDQVEGVGRASEMPAHVVNDRFVDSNGVIAQAGKQLGEKWTGKG